MHACMHAPDDRGGFGVADKLIELQDCKGEVRGSKKVGLIAKRLFNSSKLTTLYLIVSVLHNLFDTLRRRIIISFR